MARAAQEACHRGRELGSVLMGRSRPTGISVAVVVSDLHCGSVYGLLPPGFTTLEGNEVKPNRFQAWLWDRWRHVTETRLPRLLNHDPFVLIVNGDATEGCHHGTKEVISPDEGDHLEAAVQTLAGLSDAASMAFVVEGTECHTKHLEHALAKSINATHDPETGKAAWPKLRLDIHGCRLHAHHHIGTTSRPWLESGQFSVAMATERLEAASVGHRLPDVLCCAHRHRWGAFQFPHGTVVVSPAWQGLTRHGRKVVPAAQLHIGLTVLDWRDRAPGEQPIVHTLYETTAPPKVVAV